MPGSVEEMTSIAGHGCPFWRGASDKRWDFHDTMRGCPVHEALLSTASRDNSTGATPASALRHIQPTRRAAVGQAGRESDPSQLVGIARDDRALAVAPGVREVVLAALVPADRDAAPVIVAGEGSAKLVALDVPRAQIFFVCILDFPAANGAVGGVVLRELGPLDRVARHQRRDLCARERAALFAGGRGEPVPDTCSHATGEAEGEGENGECECFARFRHYGLFSNAIVA